MKTAEEILMKHTGKCMSYIESNYISSGSIINAMEDYASQFKPKPLTGETEQQKIQHIADILYSHIKDMMGLAYISQDDIPDIAREIVSECEKAKEVSDSIVSLGGVNRKLKSDPHNDIYGPGNDNYGRDKYQIY